MGAQILRCIGRAYRYSGQRVLRRHNPQNYGKGSSKVPLPMLLDVSDQLRDQWRNLKHVLTAAVASGRVVLSEEVAKRSRQQRPTKPAIDYHWSGELGDLRWVDNDDSHETALPSDEEIREEAQRKAQDAMLESLQVEALWKITKIDLDRTIREACDLILEGDYFFFPGRRTNHDDGWVGSSGIAIQAGTGRVRAAAALIMLGDIMVQRSKEGTAWME